MNIDQDTARYLMARALAYHVGQGDARPHDFVELHLLTDIPERRLYRFRDGSADPTWYELERMVEVLGPLFRNMLTMGADYGIIRFDDPLPAKEFPKHAAALVADYTDYMMDGVLCHRDMGALWHKALQVRDSADVAAKVWLEGANGR